MSSIVRPARGSWRLLGCWSVLFAACGSTPGGGASGTGGGMANGGHAGAAAGASGRGGSNGGGGANGGSSGSNGGGAGAGGASAGGSGGVAGVSGGGGAAGAAASGGAPAGGAGGVSGTGGAGGVGGTGAAGGVGGAGAAGGVGGAGGAAGLGGLGGPGGIGVGGASGGPGGSGGAGSPCVGVCGSTLAIQPTRMVYDGSRDRLYVTIQGGADQYPNTITAIDPRAATVTASTPIGSDPDLLALSDDSSTLWVGMDGSFSMRKLTLSGATPVVGPLDRIPPGTNSAAVFVQGLIPLPDSPDTVAALVSAGPNILTAYDDGVPRPNPNATNTNPSAIFNGPPGTFYGTGSTAGSGTLFWMRVLSTGIAQATFPDLLDGGQGAGALVKGGRLYVAGKVFDVSNPSTPTAVGALPFYGIITDHSSLNRLVMLSPPSTTQSGGQWALRLLDTDTLTQRGSVNVPSALLGVSPVPDTVTDFVYLGGDEVALLATALNSATRLVLLHAPMLANDGVDPGMGMGGQGGSPTTGTGGVTGTGGAGGAAGSPGALCSGCTLHQLDVPGFHMVYDEPRARLYAVLTYDAAHDPNTLVSVDVANEVVLATVPIATAPRQMALSDDGTALSIGFDESSTIQEFSVANTPPVAGPAYLLPPSGTGATASAAFPYDLVALPGSATSIAACISGGTTTRVAILDSGVARPTIDASRLFISKLAAGPAGTLFGYDGMSSAYTFASYTITSDGIALLSAQEGLMGVYQNDIHYYQGRVYADWGEVIDVSAPTNPVRAGKFDFNGLVAPRSSNRILMLTAGVLTDALELRILDSGTFTQVASLSLGTSFSDGITSASDLVYLGDDGVAFLSPGNALPQGLYIFRSPMIGTPP
jgi:hypothetical protein